jgi:3-oxoacyl-[acyl-carrier-protein] synthase-1
LERDRSQSLAYGVQAILSSKLDGAPNTPAARRRVVISGMGAVSSVGTGLPAIAEALRLGRSGITFIQEWQDAGILSQVAGVPEAEPSSPLVNRKIRRTCTSNALMALRACHEAIETAGLTPEEIRGTNMAVLVGSGTGSTISSVKAAMAFQKHKSTRRINPFTLSHVMGSTATANVSIALGIKGESWSISSACSTGAHAIGMGVLLIRTGLYERVLAGGSEELDWTRAGAFDAMGALSRKFNDRPEAASRPFDRHRDGFVISGGAGLVLLEELEAARRRNAPILAEVLGYGANSDGYDIVAPLTEGAVDVVRRALADAQLQPGEIGYVNAHGTSTPLGDPSEAAAMGTIFGKRQPFISSTKSMTGHAIGAAGSLETIYTVLMMKGGFLAPSVNVDEVDPRCGHLNLVVEAPNRLEARIAMSNSFGFGGTNACVILRRWDGPEGV